MRYNSSRVFPTVIISLMLTLTILSLSGITLTGNLALAQDDTDDDTEDEVREFRANLTGQGVIPPVATNGTGEAILSSTEDGEDMEYELDVQGIEDVINAHLHLGAERNGPLLVTLYNVQTSGQSDDGGESLVEGEFTGEDFERSLPSGQNITTLLDLIGKGDVYVDVHTLTNPKGELRGNVVETPVESVEEE